MLATRTTVHIDWLRRSLIPPKTGAAMGYLQRVATLAAAALLPLTHLEAQRAVPRLTRVAIPGLESIGPETKAAQVSISTSGLIAFSGGFDEKKRAVTVIDSKGNVVARFGPPGRGPGEIHAPFQLAFAGDNIFVLEVAGRRASLFKKDGTPLETRPTPGAFYLIRAARDSIEVLDWPTGGGLPVSTYLRISNRTLEGRTLMSAQSDAVKEMAARSKREPNAIVPILYMSLDSNIVVGNPTTYDLDVADAQGKKLYALTRMAGASQPRPTEFQAMNGLHVDGRSRLWVISDLGKDGNTMADVFSGKDHLGTIDLGCRGSVSLAGEWMAMLCAPASDPAKDVELRVFRIGG